MAEPLAVTGPAPPPEVAEGVLPRRLGVSSLMMLIIAFNAPIAVTAGFGQLAIGYGNGVGAPIAFLIAGAILLCFAAGFVGMSRFIKDPGAFYQFIVAGADRSWGLAGAFLAMTAYILLCAGSYPYMGLVATDAARRLAGQEILPWYMWSLLFLALITTICLFRVDLSMKLLGKLVCLEIALVALWQGAVLWRGGPEGYVPAVFEPASFLHGSPGLGVLFAMVCMIGIEAGACFAGETRNPEVAVGRATNLSIAFLSIFYAGVAWLYIVTQGPSHAVFNATHDPVGSFFSSVQTYLGTTFLHIVSLTLVTSQMMAITSVQGSASRYLFSLGRDGVLPGVLARVHSRWQSPYVAVGAVALISATVMLATLGLGVAPVTSYAALTGMGVYFLLPLMIATSVAVILFYGRNRALPASLWTRLIAPTLSAFGLIALFLLCSGNLEMLVGSKRAAIAAIIAALLVPLSGWMLARFYRRHRPETYARIGNQ